MNNQRLLARMLCTFLLSGGLCAHGQRIVTLEEVFAQAEANSAMLRPSISAQEEAKQAVSEAKAARLPDINASLSISYIGDGFTTKRNFSDYMRAPIPHLGDGLGVTVEQPLYAGGAIKNSIKMAELKQIASGYATESARDALRIRLASFYFDIYRSHSLRNVVEKNIEAARKVLGEMRARHEQGTTLQNDITRYELLVSNLDLQLTNIDNTLKILNNNLVTVSGLPEGTIVLPDTTLLEQALPDRSEEWWQREADINAPSLALARTGIDISRRAEKLAEADRLPKIGLQAGWTIDGPILVEIPPVNRNLSYWYVGLGINYNISSLYKTNKTLARCRTATRRSLQELEAVRKSVSMDVRAAHIRYLESYEQLKTREKGLELAERNYHVVSTRYAEGMALITDMLDAANARLEAGERLVDARINIINCYYILLFNSGKI